MSPFGLIRQRDPREAAPRPAKQGRSRSGGRVPYWTSSDVLVSRGSRWLLLGALACGPAAVGLQFLSPPVPVARPVVASVDDSPARTAAGEVAQAWVVAWLTATQDTAGALQQRMGTVTVTLPTKPSQVANPQVASVAPAGAGVWSVVVGVDVTDPGATAPVHRYYQVPVGFRSALNDRGGDPAQLAVLGLPAPVPGPASFVPPATQYALTLAVDSPVGKAAGAFLGALVAGQGDVTRYVSPTSQIRAVSPPLATTVRVQSIVCLSGQSQDAQDASPGDGTTVQVLVSADLLTADGQARTSQYALTLRARAGRWEVAALDPAPVLAKPVSSTPSVSASAGTNH